MTESSSSSQDDRPDGQVPDSALGAEDRVPAPLVVIQYRSNPAPIILLSLGIVVLGLGGFAYHQRAVARLDRRAAEAATAIVASAVPPSSDRLRPVPDSAGPAGSSGDENGMPGSASVSKIAEPLALNTQPTPVAVRPKPDVVTKVPAIKAAESTPSIDRAGAGQPAAGETAKVVSAPAHNGVVAAVADQAVVPFRKSKETIRPVPTEVEKAESVAPPEIVLKPLPSKEETLREIENEANLKLAEIADRERMQFEELRSTRVESRSRFRKDLRELLEAEGARAGKAIDALSEKYREYIPPTVHRRASRIWSSSGRSIDQRIQLIRALGLPEALILDLMSDDFYQNLRARNGPRTKSEVRVRAAILLLKHDPEEIAAVAEQTPGTERGDNRPTNASARPGIR